MNEPLPNKYLWAIYGVIAVLVVALISLTIGLLDQSHSLMRLQTLHGRHVRQTGLRTKHTLGAQDVTLISSWMTFDYISVAYQVPAPRLLKDLGIAGARLPRMTLAKYAHAKGLSTQNFTNQVIIAVHRYLTASSSSRAGRASVPHSPLPNVPLPATSTSTSAPAN